MAEELSYKTMKRLNSASIKAKKKIILLTVSAAEYGQTETLKFLIYNVGMSLLVGTRMLIHVPHRSTCCIIRRSNSLSATSSKFDLPILEYSYAKFAIFNKLMELSSAGQQRKGRRRRGGKGW